MRAIYLTQSAAAPSFLVPIVDSDSYDRLARELVEGQIPGRLFYQGSFYPLFLALVYQLSAGSVVAAKLVQALIGAGTCALTAVLGRRLFEPRVGLAAGIVAALHAPLFFFDGELLATGWSAFWSVALLLWLLHTDERPGPWRMAGLGIAGALAVLTRATFAPFFAFACAWLALRLQQQLRTRRARFASLAALLAGFVLLCAPLVWLGGKTNDHYALLPHSGGLNLYIGNNPTRAETLATRPADFHRIGDLPGYHGAHSPEERQRFYTGRVFRYAVSDPVGFVAGQLAKTIEFASPRELPRNVDLYVFRQWSSLLSALVWKLGPWGFPNGLLFPLALLGLALHWRRLPLPVVAFPILSAGSIILVFVSARYRVALAPIMAILACAAIASLARLLASGHWRRALALAALTALASLSSALPGPFAQERTDYQTELHYSVGTQQVARATALLEAGHPLEAADSESRARQHLRAVLERDPGYAAAHANLGVLELRSGNLEQADRHFRSALRFDPSQPIALEGRTRCLIALGRSIELRRHLLETERIRKAVRQQALTR